MNKQDVFNYIMKTPNNTNPAILKEMLDSISSGGNQNRRDMLSGTLATIAEDLESYLTENGISSNTFATMLSNREMSAKIDIDAEAIGIGNYLNIPFFQTDDYHIGFQLSIWTLDESGVNPPTFEIGVLLGIATSSTYSVSLRNISVYDTSTGEQDITSYASSMDYTLYIYNHPIPD